MIRSTVAALRLAALVAGLLASPAFAADSSDENPPADPSAESAVPEEFRGMVGDWVLEQEDEDLPQCPITLSDAPAPGGWAIVLPQDCPAPYPAAASMTSWTIDPNDGSVLLMDGSQTVTLRLLEDEDGLFDTAPGTNPRFYLLAPYDDNGTGGEPDSED
jgi:hypothetical protein